MEKEVKILLKDEFLSCNQLAYSGPIMMITLSIVVSRVTVVVEVDKMRTWTKNKGQRGKKRNQEYFRES